MTPVEHAGTVSRIIYLERCKGGCTIHGAGIDDAKSYTSSIAKPGDSPLGEYENGANMTGASFTVSSLGRWGVDAFSPIIAAPQVAILGVGRVNRVAREGPGGAVRFTSEICLTLVFDHRANDGVAAAQFLASIVGYLEQPERMEIIR